MEEKCGNKDLHELERLLILFFVLFFCMTLVLLWGHFMCGHHPCIIQMELASSFASLLHLFIVAIFDESHSTCYFQTFEKTHFKASGS